MKGNYIVLMLMAVFVGGLSVVKGEVTLTSPTQNITENTPVTLICSYTGSLTVLAYFMYVSSSSQKPNQEGSMLEDCSIFAKQPDQSLYEYKCTTKQLSWTIKNVTLTSDGKTWICKIAFSDSSSEEAELTISVQVPITFVQLTSPNNSIITVRENTEAIFKCITSGGLPKATITWFKSTGASTQPENEVDIDSKISSLSSTVNGLEEVTSTLRYLPSRNDNGLSLYCKATNIAGQRPFVSKKLLMEIQFPPDSPVINGLENGGEYRVIENTQGKLSCYINGGNPAPTLSWDCYNSGTSISASVGTVSKIQTWKAERGKNRTCTCRSSHYSAEKSVSVNIVILYPPTVPMFTINGSKVSGTVKIIRSSSLSISCISSGNPTPSYMWTYANSHQTFGQDLTIENVQSDVRLTCNVQNTMDPTGVENVTGNNTSYIDVVLLFPPKLLDVKETNIVIGSRLNLSCPSVKGNPPETTFQWTRNCDNQEWNNQSLYIANVTKTDDVYLYS